MRGVPGQPERPTFARAPQSDPPARRDAAVQTDSRPVLSSSPVRRAPVQRLTALSQEIVGSPLKAGAGNQVLFAYDVRDWEYGAPRRSCVFSMSRAPRTGDVLISSSTDHRLEIPADGSPIIDRYRPLIRRDEPEAIFVLEQAAKALRREFPAMAGDDVESPSIDFYFAAERMRRELLRMPTGTTRQALVPARDTAWPARSERHAAPTLVVRSDPDGRVTIVHGRDSVELEAHTNDIRFNGQHPTRSHEEEVLRLLRVAHRKVLHEG